MKIIADESVDFGIIKKLRENNFEVISISESNSGISDIEVLGISSKHKCLLITEDKDFGELTYRLKLEHFGILLIRLNETIREERINQSVQTIIQYFEELNMNFSVLNTTGLMIKRKITQ
jgi:predicted nuclease of predicted toxin-antitoxin system